jgi:branched-subunit amino acid ABC-type transport system permease component
LRFFSICSGYGLLPVSIPGAASDAIAVAIFMVILLFRPEGFFGHEMEMGDNQQSKSPISTATGRKRWTIPVACGGGVVFLFILPLLLSSLYTLGPIIGAAILVLIPEFFRSLKMYSPYITAVILLIVVYLMPGGLASLPQVVRSWYMRRRKEERVSHLRR